MTSNPDSDLRLASLKALDAQIRRRQKGEAVTAEPGGGGIPAWAPVTSQISARAERDAEAEERAEKMRLIQAAMAEHHQRREADTKNLLTAVAGITGVPLARLMEVPPLRGDAAELMHRARQIAGR